MNNKIKEKVNSLDNRYKFEEHANTRADILYQSCKGDSTVMRAELNLDMNELCEAVALRVIKGLKPLLKHDTEDSIFDVQGLAEYLKVKPAWIYQQTHVNGIPYFKVGNLLRFKKSDIDDWLNKNKTPAIND